VSSGTARRLYVSEAADLAFPVGPTSFGQQRLVEILERSCTATGSRRSTLEDGFEIVVMVFIETTKHQGFLQTS
jgi:hypothetical protein